MNGYPDDAGDVLVIHHADGRPPLKLERRKQSSRLPSNREFQRAAEYVGSWMERDAATPSEQRPAEPPSDNSAMPGEARALAVLVKHPDWTDTQIATAANVNRKSLYRWPAFVAARAAAREGGKESRPRGQKDASGIEAWRHRSASDDDGEEFEE